MKNLERRGLIATLALLLDAVIGDPPSRYHPVLKQGIQVRDCASFGLPEYIRIATRRPEENPRVLAAVRGAKSWHD